MCTTIRSLHQLSRFRRSIKCDRGGCKDPSARFERSRCVKFDQLRRPRCRLRRRKMQSGGLLREVEHHARPARIDGYLAPRAQLGAHSCRLCVRARRQFTDDWRAQLPRPRAQSRSSRDARRERNVRLGDAATVGRARRSRDDRICNRRPCTANRSTTRIFVRDERAARETGGTRGDGWRHGVKDDGLLQQHARLGRRESTRSERLHCRVVDGLHAEDSDSGVHLSHFYREIRGAFCNLKGSSTGSSTEVLGPTKTSRGGGILSHPRAMPKYCSDCGFKQARIAAKFCEDCGKPHPARADGSRISDVHADSSPKVREEDAIASIFASTLVFGSPSATERADNPGGSSEQKLPRCSRCLRDSHSATRCYASTRADGSRISESAEPREAVRTTISPIKQVGVCANSKIGCSRCGRENHTVAKCYASTHADGSRIRDVHAESSPKNREEARTSVVHASGSGGGVFITPSCCSRCLRDSHTVDQCLASSRADGSLITDGSAQLEREAVRIPITHAGGNVNSETTTLCYFCDRGGHNARSCPRSQTYAEHLSLQDDPPPRGRRIVNIQGSSLDSPTRARSWRAEAESILGPSKLCAVLGCVRMAEEGCHVFVEGVRDAYFIAPMCKQCNHRHGHEEICFCRYMVHREEPQAWMPIRDMWLYKIKSSEGVSGDAEVWKPFSSWCIERASLPSHNFRERCFYACVGGKNEAVHHSQARSPRRPDAGSG